MVRKLIWMALTSLKRNVAVSWAFIVLAFALSAQIFLAEITINLLTFPEVSGIKAFFYSGIITTILLMIVMLPIISEFYYRSKSKVFYVFRIFGVSDIDIVMLYIFEIFIFTLMGSIAGVMLILILIKTNILFLPDFFRHLAVANRLNLLKISGLVILRINSAVIAFSGIYQIIKIKIRFKSISKEHSGGATWV